MSAANELVGDIKIIRQHLEALHKEVAGLSKRAQEQGKHLSRAELDEVLAKVKKETSFRISYKDVAESIQPHLATPAKLDAVLMGSLQQIEQMLNQIPRSVPVEGKVWGYTDWRVAVLSIGMPLLFLLLLLWFPGFFSLVPKKQLERVQAQLKAQENQTGRVFAAGKQAVNIGGFYSKQIKSYVRKHPKAAADFPEYIIPQKPSQE